MKHPRTKKKKPKSKAPLARESKKNTKFKKCGTMNDPPSMGLVWEWGHCAIHYAHNRGHKNSDIYCPKRPPTSNMIVVLLRCGIQKYWKQNQLVGLHTIFKSSNKQATTILSCCILDKHAYYFSIVSMHGGDIQYFTAQKLQKKK